MEELWREVKGFSGYSVSNFGNVKSTKQGKDKLLKQKTNKCGYKEVALQDDDHKQIMKRVSRLVAEAFIPNPDNLAEVNHIDENKENNCVSNLEWMTHGDNTRYSLAKKVVQLLNGVVIKEYESIKDASRQTGFPVTSISYVCNGKKSKLFGYTFRFAKA